MGLFDELAGMAGGMGGAGGGGQPTADHPEAGPLGAVMAAIQSHPGGIGGLVSSFEQSGLGGVAQSWIGGGPNQPVSPDQVQSAVGGSMVQNVANQLGVSPQTAAGHIAQYLPMILNHLTPNGQVPQDGQGGMGALGGLLSQLRG